MPGHKQRTRLGVLYLALFCSLTFPALTAAQEGAPLPPPVPAHGYSLGNGLHVAESTPGRIVLELNVPDLVIARPQFPEQRYAILSAPGLENASVPGKPDLPQTGVLIGLPPSGGWSVKQLEMERRMITLAHSVRPVPDVVASRDGRVQPQAQVRPPLHPDKATYDSDAFYPSMPVVASEGGLLHDMRVMRLGFHPVRYNPVRGQLEQILRLVVEVEFETPVVGTPRPPDTWDPILKQAVINYDVARYWRGVHPQEPPGTVNPPATREGSFKIEVEHDGLYLLSYEDLERAGFPVTSVEPNNVHLTTGGREVAVKLELGPDGKFTPGDWLLFYGEAARGRFTRLNIYWLFSDATAGLRMGSRSVAPQGLYPVPSTRWFAARTEQNNIYDGLYSEPDGDHWYWAQLQCPDAVWGRGDEGEFDLPLLAEQVHTATLGISLQGHTFNTHHLDVQINGHSVGNIVWDGPTRVTSIHHVPSAWLQRVGNELVLEARNCPTPPAPPNEVVLNYFEVEHLADFEAISDGEGNPLLDFYGEAGNWQYELDGFPTANVGLLDLTDASRPVMLTAADWANGRLTFQDQAAERHRYLATAKATIRTPPVYRDNPSNLAVSSADVDYLLIGYGLFLPATQPLLDLRVAQGLSVMSVDVQDVYDEFSYGLLNPEALRTFLSQVAAAWRDPPAFVLLVGDGTIDFHDYRGNGWHNYLPAYPANVELHAGPNPAETASDNELDPGGILPFFQIGRLPVSSIEQAEAVVAKIVQYEVAPPPPLWNRHVLFVADKVDQAGQSFADHSDEVQETVAEPLAAQRIYLVDGSPTLPHEYATEAARAAVRDRFIAGQLAVTYMGHSSPSQWSADVLLHRNEVPGLRNGGRLPVVLSMTCYTGAFQWPDYAPLDERLVVEPGGGAVAAWGATGSAVATGHRHLARGFFDALQNEAAPKLGAATYSGLARLYAQAEALAVLDLIDTYVLLGDPAMTLNRFTGDVRSTHVPLVVRSR